MSIEGLDGKFVTCQAFSACLLLVGGEEHEWHESYLPSRATNLPPAAHMNYETLRLEIGGKSPELMHGRPESGTSSTLSTSLTHSYCSASQVQMERGRMMW